MYSEYSGLEMFFLKKHQQLLGIFESREKSDEKLLTLLLDGELGEIENDL